MKTPWKTPLAAIAALWTVGWAFAQPEPTRAMPAPGQETSSIVLPSERPLRFKRLSVEDGLAHSAVFAIHQDRRGFLWIATQDGLSLWDGIRFRTFRHDPDDPSSLASNEVVQVMEDHRGELWIGTDGGGLQRFDRTAGRFERFRHDPDDITSLSHDFVLRLAEDSTGRLWVGTFAGLDLFDSERGTFTHYRHNPGDPESLPSSTISALHPADDGTLWVGTSRGLSRLDTKDGKVTSFRHDPNDPASMSHDRVHHILEAGDGKLWVSTLHGLNLFDPENGTSVRYLHDPEDPDSLAENRIFALHRGSDGTLWIGTYGGGLDRLGPDRQRFLHERHRIGDPESLASDAVFSIFEDHTGILWVGTLDGLHKMVPRLQAFDVVRQRPGTAFALTSDRIWSIAQSKNDALWLGTFESGLNQLDPNTGRTTAWRADPSDPDSIPDDVVSALLMDREDTLWVGTFRGVARLDARRGKFVPYPPAPTASRRLRRILSLAETADGTLWAGTSGGLTAIDHTAQSVRPVDAFGDPATSAQTSVFAIREDRNAALWLATNSGLTHFDPSSGDSTFHRRVAEDPSTLSSDRVAALHLDRAGRVWAGTLGGGLNRLDPSDGRVVRYRQANGLPGDSVLGILEDADGYLWLATTQGLGRFDPLSETCRVYDRGDGLPGDVFSAGAALHGRSGQLLFGGTRGLVVFRPGQVHDDPYPPPVEITEVRVGAAALADIHDPFIAGAPSAEAEITLSSDERTLAIRFAALHFADPQGHQYAYRLEGLDPDWIDADTGQTTVRYANLAPGNYTFWVRASNHDGVWNEEGTSLRITAMPPAWRTPWAFGIYGATLAFFALLTIRSRRKRLATDREVTRLKDHLLAEMQLLAEERGAQLGEREQLVAQLEDQNAELERFTYTVSHDLKSPLFTIRGFLGLVRREIEQGRPERRDEYLDRIANAVDRMSALLDDLLDLSRIGRVIHPPQPLDLGTVVQEAVELVAGRIAERGVEVEILPGMPRVFADRIRLREVFQNLIDNAVRYMGSTPSPRIEIGAHQGKDDALVWVRDNGIGIPREYQEKIFGLFDRLDPSLEGGTGVGLTLVRRIVELHGGRVWVESEGTGLGSVFYLTLGLAPEDGQPDSILRE